MKILHIKRDVKLAIDSESIASKSREGPKRYLWQSHVGDNNGVERARSIPEGLVLVTVGMVLVLEHLALIISLPGHGAVADANIAFRGHGGGLAAEIPVFGN